MYPFDKSPVLLMKCSFVGGKTPLAHIANRFSSCRVECHEWKVILMCFFLKKNTAF